MAKTLVALYDRAMDADDALRALKADPRFDRDDISVLAHDDKNMYSRGFSDAPGVRSSREPHTSKAGEHTPERQTEVRATGVRSKPPGKKVYDVSVGSHHSDRDSDRPRAASDAETTTPADAAAKGAAIGAAVGGVGGLLVGLGVLALPGGALVAAGPLASALIGAVGGAAAGGIIGGLVGLGIDEDDAHAYAEGVRRGGRLIIVRCDESNVSAAAELLNRFDPVDIHARAARWRAEGWSGRYTDDTVGATYTRTYPAPADVLDNPIAAPRPIVQRDDHTPAPGQPDPFTPAYQLGHSLGHNMRYRGAAWETICLEAERRWTIDHGPLAPWPEVADYVRFGFDQGRRKAQPMAAPLDGQR